MYTATQTILIQVIDHSFPVLLRYSVPDSFKICVITLIEIDRDCYLNDSLEAILGLTPDISYTISPQNPKYYVDVESNLLTWDRSAIWSSSPSDSITIKLIDSYGATMIIDPFIFYPNYIPEFSDLIESTNQPHIIDIFTAYYDSYWERAFILEDGYSYYPGDIAEILIRLTNDKGQDIILDNGKLKLTPNIYDENMTISVFYTDTSIPPLTVTRNYDIFVSENHKPYINPIPETQRIAISNEEFALDFVNFGEDLDNDVIEYEMGATPYLNMQLSGTRFAWTPTSEYIGQIISVNFKLWDDLKYSYNTYDLLISVQPRLCLSLSNNIANYQQEFFAKIDICSTNKAYFKIDWLKFEIMTRDIPLDFYINNDFGDLKWENPIFGLNFEVKVSIVSDKLYYNEHIQVFSIEIRPESIYPKFGASVPLPEAKKYANSRELWSLDIECTHPLQTVIISVVTDKMTVVKASENLVELRWSPSDLDLDSGIINIYCTSFPNNLEISYSFIIAPVYRARTVPVCETDDKDIVDWSLSQNHQLVWYDDDSRFYQMTVILAEEYGIEQFKLYKWGYFEWSRVVPYDDFSMTTEIHNNITSTTCDLRLNYIFAYKDPTITAKISAKACEDLVSTSCSVSLSLSTDGDIHSYSLNTTQYFSNPNRSTVIWTPPNNLAYEYVKYSALGYNALNAETTTLVCQGVQCRLWPVIQSISCEKSDFCEKIGDVLKFKVFSPQTQENVIINGYNFGKVMPSVWIGNKECVVSTYTDASITCRVPMPTFEYLENLFVIIYRNDLGYTNSAKKLFSYTAEKIPVVVLPTISPLYLYPNDSDEIIIPVSADLILPFCYCKAAKDSGQIFIAAVDYLGQIYSECTFSDFAGDFTIYLCCQSTCSTEKYLIKAVTDISMTFDADSSSGHTHGLYDVSSTLTFTGNYVYSDIIFEMFGFYLGFSKLSTDQSKFVFQMPPYTSPDSSSIQIRISLNRGLTFSNLSQSPTFRFTGKCLLGQYISKNRCLDCPAGSWCDYEFPDIKSYYYSPMVCDLGYYQNETAQTSCKICPIGHNCFCREMSQPVTCDAGYVCDIEGITKRYMPCPPGSYCPSGAETSISLENPIEDSITPILCDVGTYCTNGAYTSQIIKDDYYTPQSCFSGANCARGSSNPQGIRDCLIGYFCIDWVTARSSVLLITLDLLELCDHAGLCECPVGYSCSSSTQTEPKQCDQGYYQDKRAQGKCEPCEAGFYCYQYYLIPPKTPTICPNGHKCLPLSTNPTKCEVGTYQDEQGKNECKLCPIGQYSKIIGQSKCKTCEAGFMCDTEGISTYKTDCPKGYYCLAGTNMSPNGCDTSQISNVTDDLIYPNACEEGFYCPGKTIFPISCGVRSYNPYPCQSACINCPNGYMCSKTGMSEPTPCPIGFACFDDSQISCTPGHYCLDRTETNNPDLDVERKPLPCAKGHFCTGGNVLGVYDSDIKNSAAYCSYGTYMNETGASECYKCPAGYECLDQGMIEPVICPSGTYRIEGLTPISCTECPEGTYNNRTGATSPDYCIACEGGLVCIASRLSWLNSTNSELCSAGYFCPAGTNRATRNDYHCAAGFYCFTGTASKNESEMNICPEGRYCTAGTAASEAVYAECLKGAECKIGLTCTPGSYCPAGSPEVLNCPIGLTSYSSAKSVKDCFRDTSNFYDVDIVAVQNAFPTFTIKPNTYLEFSLDFTWYYGNATVPNDLQQTTIITPIDKNRRLSDSIEPVRVLIISHQNYGTKQSVPINNNLDDLLMSKQPLVIGLYSSIWAEVTFEIEYLDGQYNTLYNWTEVDISANTMSPVKTGIYDKSFLFVISREIGDIMLDPTNIYKIFKLNKRYSTLSSLMELENRFFLTLVTEDEDSSVWKNQTADQYSYSYWKNLTVDEYPIVYIPYVADCYPGYGSNLPISSMINDERCTLIADPKSVDLYGFFDKIEGTNCKYSLKCDYGVDLTHLNRGLRWYEAYTGERNSKSKTKQSLPPFYVTRYMYDNDMIAEYTKLNKKIDDVLIPVKARRYLDDISWSRGDVPSSVKLKLGYYQKDAEHKEILYAELVFSDYMQGSEFGNTATYNFTFEFSALDWVDVFDYDGFNPQAYIWLLFLASGLIFGSLFFAFLIPGLIFCPVKLKPKGFVYILNQIFHSLIGFFIILIPLSIEVWLLWSFFVWGGVFDFQVGSYLDKIPIHDETDSRIITYQAGRIGTCMALLGLTLIKWGTDFMIPPTTQMGFSIQEEMQKLKEIMQLPKRQGLVVGSLGFVCFIGLILVCLADNQVIEDWFYIIIPVLKFCEYVLSLIFLKKLKDQLYIMPIRFGLKISIYLMILSFEKLHKMVASYALLFAMRLIEEIYFVKYHNFFVLSYLSKSFEKATELQDKDRKSRRRFINSLAELSDKSVSTMITWIFPTTVLFIFLFYEFTAYSMIKVHYLYFFLFTVFFIPIEPFLLLLANYIRTLQDKHYFCPEIHELSNNNFRERQTSWSLSYIKIHNANLKLSNQVDKLFCTGFSGQLYLILATIGYGFIFFIFGLKLLSFNSYSPFLDLWLFLYGLFAFVTSSILKKIAHTIGKKMMWKLSVLNTLYQKDANGEVITSRDDYIRDRFVRVAMNNASKTKPVIDMSISDTTDDIIRIIKNSSNRALLSFKIGEKMKEFDVANKVSKEKVFKMYHRNVEAFSLNNLKEQLRRAKDPVYKIILRTAERIKEGKKVPSFPSELVYRWEDSDLNQSKSTI